jgi:hypothetical protein
MTIIQRTLDALASEQDDFFDEDAVLEYLNSTLLDVVTRLSAIERSSPRSLRSLDNLRVVSTTTTSGIAPQGNFFTGTVAVPQELYELQYVEYNLSIPLREIATPQLYQLRWGNAVPTSAEGYYNFTKTGGTRVLRYYVHRADSDLPINLNYIQRPTALNKNSTTITGLPDRFINVLVYGAAEMASIKENARESADNALAYRKFSEKYQQYFQNAAF